MYRVAWFLFGVVTFTSSYGAPYDDSGNSVIRLHVTGGLKEPLPGSKSLDLNDWGTGFFVSPDGLILSAGHLIPDPDLLDEDGYRIDGYLPTSDGDSFNADEPAFSVEVIAATVNPYDVALLKIKEQGPPRPYLRLCDGYKKVKGTMFPVYGYPGGDALQTASWGPIQSGAGAVSHLVVQVPLSGGNSGGPVFNEAGQVFGLAIGERTVGGKRMQVSSLAVPMAKVMVTLGDKAKQLIGVSYDPDCQKHLDNSFAYRFTEDYYVLNTAVVFGDVIVANGRQEISAVHDIPPGYQATEILNAVLYVDEPRAVGEVAKFIPQPKVKKVELSENGTKLRLDSEGINKSGAVKGEIDVVLKRLPPSPLAEFSKRQVRTFPFTRTLDTHDLKITKTEFVDKIEAPKGLKFVEVLSVRYQSLNRSPSNGASVSVTEEGRYMRVVYTLESGPKHDMWNGWIDGFITAKLAPVGESVK